MGHVFNMATIQEETTIKKITRIANLSTVMDMCTNLTCTISNRFTFGHFFAKIQGFQNDSGQNVYM